MRKLKLDVDALAVETFAAADAAEPAGTVHGNDDDAPSRATVCCPPTWQRTCGCPETWNCTFDC